MRKLSDLTEEYVVKFCPTLASVTGLLGGYKVASSTGIRPLGGAILAPVSYTHLTLPTILRV